MVKQKASRKTVSLTDSQIKRLQELYEFDGLDPVEHVRRAIDEYLKNQNIENVTPQEIQISVQVKQRYDDPKISQAVWVSGLVGKYEFSALILNSSSKLGIDKGRISKLSIWDPVLRKQTNNFIGSCIVNYDRGWDIRPSKIAQPYYEKVKQALDKYLKG